MIRGDLILAANEPGTVFSDPTFWINLGVAGVFLFMFVTGKIHPQSTLDKIEARAAKDAADAKEREIQLRGERDRALAERDEMIEVMKDFTHTASAILQFEQTRRPPQRRPEK